GEAGRHVEAFEDRLDLFLAVLLGDRVDVAEAEGAHEQRALVAPGHLSRGQYARRPDFDLEARRQLDLFDQRIELRIRRTGRRTRRRREALLGFGLVAKEPVIRRMSPEILGTGFIFFQWPCRVRFLLRVGQASAGQKTDSRKRKYGSMERRFHRITP